MQSGGLLETLVSALREVKGYFVWRDSTGEEYIIISRQEFEQRGARSEGTQLDLLSEPTLSLQQPTRNWSADDMLDKINHDLALYQLQREEEVIEEVGEVVEEDESEKQFPLPPKPSAFAPASADSSAETAGRKVRFEPLRGDLAPDLQD